MPGVKLEDRFFLQASRHQSRGTSALCSLAKPWRARQS
jgi:hypothetical protein